MKNLEVIATWKKWVEKSDSAAGDVSPFDAKEGCPWFPPPQQAKASKHFHCFARTGDGTLVALWSQQGDSFDDAPVVALGGEGELGWVAKNASEAIALFAAAGDEGFDETLAYGDLGETDEELADFVSEKFDTEVPDEFEIDESNTRSLVELLNALTGKSYRAFGD